MLTISRRRLLAASFGPFLPNVLRSAAAIADEIMFPENFVWGASTSSYQIEGAVDARRPRQEHLGRLFAFAGAGEGRRHRRRRLRPLSSLARGHRAAVARRLRRLSLLDAWPRILPEGAGVVEQRGLDFYDRLVDGLAARAITPWLCLYHWDLPQALEDKGGWRNRDTAQRFADYAGIVAQRLGDRVKHWITFNEPNIHALFGYGTRRARAGRQRPAEHARGDA